MPLTLSSASVVAEPDVVARSRKDKSWSLVIPIHNPLHHVRLDAMLEQNGLSFFGLVYSIKAKNVAILSHYLMPLRLEAIFFAKVLQASECVLIEAKF